VTRSLLWILFAAVFALQQDGPPPATVTGRVVDGGTGAPIARAVVIVRGAPDYRPIERVTGADGRFAFTGLRPGRYDIQAGPGEFKATHVWSQMNRSRFVDLKPGETRDLPLTLDRALAISGHVVDEAGLPLARVRIRVRNLATGSDYYSSGERASDDLGAFRVYGLPAGRVIVCAEGNFSPTFERVVNSHPIRFVQTCYPSSLGEEGAEPVVLRDAEIDGLQIRMRRSRTFSVSGVVVDSNGAPAQGANVGLTRIERTGSSGSSQQVPNSEFRIADVVPGNYVVSATIGSGPSPTSAPAESGTVRLEITSEDVEGLVVATRKPVSVRGVVVFEDGPPPDIEGRKLTIGASQMENGPSLSGGRPFEVQPDWAFEVKDLFGPHALSLQGLPAGYVVRSVRYRGRDITDIVTDFDGDPRNTVEIVVTRRAAELSGRVLDERGEPVEAARVYLFPADSTRWRAWMGGGAQSGDPGVFRIRNQAPGDYFVVAISQEDQQAINGAEWYRPSPYERFAAIAERITLLDNDRRVMDLRLTPIPQEWKR